MIGDGRRRSPAQSAPLTALCSAATGAADAAIFGEVVGGCGHTFVWDAGKETLGWSSLSLFLPPHHCTPPTYFAHMCTKHANVLSWHAFVCTVHPSVCVSLFAAERKQGGVGEGGGGGGGESRRCGSYGVVSMVA